MPKQPTFTMTIDKCRDQHLSALPRAIVRRSTWFSQGATRQTNWTAAEDPARTDCGIAAGFASLEGYRELMSWAKQFPERRRVSRTLMGVSRGSRHRPTSSTTPQQRAWLPCTATPPSSPLTIHDVFALLEERRAREVPARAGPGTRARTARRRREPGRHRQRMTVALDEFGTRLREIGAVTAVRPIG